MAIQIKTLQVRVKDRHAAVLGRMANEDQINFRNINSSGANGGC